VTIGGQDRILALAHDITDRKRAAEELTRQRESLYQREKLAALGSLLAGVAHELNNPLSVVVARAVLLEEQGDSVTRASALKIRTAAERCARIVRTFLAMARQQRPTRGPVAVNDVVVAALDITSYAVRTSSIEVTLDLSKDVPLILADASAPSVLLNLIINAQQSCRIDPRHGGYGSPAASTRLRTIRITVADNGPGIPRHLRARVFEPFHHKPVGPAWVSDWRSVWASSKLGGTLTVDCPIDGGAVFTSALPVGAMDVTVADAGSSRKATTASHKILVVDDEAEIRDTLAAILTGARHRVVTAGSGREALERMAAEHYDVILTDIRMPDIDGQALYQEIAQRWPRRGRAASSL
jgi:two-component system NtrC family sensor kinase